jgi:hypothetical protein
MPKPAPYARIAITLPQADLDSAERLAKALDRSRSWVVAEAVRRFAVAAEQDSVPGDIGPSRRAQLLRDLALTPEQRVRIAEETARLQVESNEPERFETFDDFLASLHEDDASV